jgi:hypothetical protein
MVYSQDLTKGIIKVPYFNVSYAGQLPMGVYGDRFGANSSLGFIAGMKNKENFTFEIEGTFMFSQNVKEDVLIPLRNSSGFIVNINGQPAAILVQHRGFTETIMIGKLLPIIGPNENSGLHIKLGLGTMHHKIRIDNENSLVPELNKPKQYYYDRLTFGFLIKQYVGYYHLSTKRLRNFTAGLEFGQGFTRGMRDYQIDLMAPYRGYRLDYFVGARIGWTVPVYRRTNKDFYFD